MTVDRVGKPGGESDLRERKRLRTQAALFDCAALLIAEKGYDNVSVEEICARAEVGRATFFRYFGAKSGLMIEFERRIAEDVRSRIGAPDMSIEDKLDAISAAVIGAWSSAHPNLRALGLDYLSSTAVRDMEAVAVGIRDLAREILQAGIDSGELRSLTSAGYIASVYVMAVRMSIYQAIEADRRGLRTDAIQMVRRLFLDGLRSDPAGGEGAHRA